jgi:UDP-N-acetylmuramoyl-tripeptide--D-alanyl-D-alanine ligase
MKPLPLATIRQLVSGKPLSTLPSHVEIKSVSTDTRMLEPGALFVAIKAERDGLSFLPDAAAKGAVAALVEDEPQVKLPNVHLIKVPSTRAALAKLATHVRGQISAHVIAVGGSNGKTGTKNLIDSALRRHKRGSISPKSFNNDIGVPLAIFPADPHQDYLVLEIGTNHHGEIRPLTLMARPDIAVITNCSAEHLEGLGDLMGVRREEASIIEGLDEKTGLLVVNGDDQALLDAVAHYKGKKVTFGFSEKNDLFATDVVCDTRGVKFKLNGRRDVFIPLLGRHTAANALAAIAVARRVGLAEDLIIDSLAHATGPEWRLQIQHLGPITLLNDAYNANPASMQAALKTLLELPTAGRRVAILGDMRELGDSADRLHKEMGQFVATCEIDLLICVGEKSVLILQEAIATGFSKNKSLHFPDTLIAATNFSRHIHSGDLVLLKGSRYMALEKLVAPLTMLQTRRVAS